MFVNNKNSHHVQLNDAHTIFLRIMPKSIPTGCIPPENFFERANPGHPGNFLSNFPAPGRKMMVEFPGVGQNFPKLGETAP